MFETTLGVQNPAAKLMAIADASSAAEVAAGIARSASAWALNFDQVADDVAEVVSAAGRARRAAESAELADSADEAWSAARAAWAAATSAQEADARINAAIADTLVTL